MSVRYLSWAGQRSNPARVAARVLLASAIAVAALSLAAPAQAVIGDPVPDATGAIFNEDQWVNGTTTYNQLYSDYYGGTGIHAPKATPTAGETFYLHAWAALIWTGVTNDVAGMTLNLPPGVSVATGGSPVKCYVTGTRSNGVPTRQTGECPANPSPTTGVQIPIGAFTLFTGGPSVGGEIIHVFVPVTANRAISGESVSVSTSFSDPAPSPRDLVGDAPLTVNPKSGTDPNVSPATLAKPGGQSFKWVGRGKAKLSWKAVPGAAGYQLRLKSGGKITKWNAVAVNRATLVKLKPGKKYVLQVRAVSVSGRGPIAKWRFKAK
jgi:Fibronectin type III domain